MHAGSIQWPRCTLAYAPPDVVVAVYENRSIEMDPAQDVWALALMAYEAIVGGRTLQSITDVKLCAAGQPYPWELPAAQQVPAWRSSRLRSLVEPCLTREAAARPSAAALAAAVSDLGHLTRGRA